MFDKKFSRRNFIKMASLTALAFAGTNFIGEEKISAAKNCTARTRYGIYNGFVRGGVQTWLGIPYAKPPVGNLRWRAPEKLEPSSAEFDAKKLGFSPMQDIDETEPASLLPQSEDCLTLNIWTKNSAEKKPVMVFIPGGAFISGGSGDPIYNGANFAAKNDVVIVTINYRLNVFGFMNFSAVDSTFEDTGYLGIKDQIAALEWVHENIENFGGDPDNVTIFGESAGAGSVMLLMILPEAKKFFGKAIAQSGHIAFYHEPQYSAAFAEEFMQFGGYENMQQLLNAPAAALNETYTKWSISRSFAADVDYLPTCDGKFLPKLPVRALKDGAASGIKFLSGTNADEYRYWSLYYERILNILPDIHMKLSPIFYEEKVLEDEYKKIYAAWQKNHLDFPENERYLEFANQIDWHVPQELCAEYQSAFDESYFYLFDQKSPVKNLGACHAIDLPFVFGNPSPKIEPKPSAKLVKQIQATWTAFATTGDPNNALIPPWKKYSAADRQTMKINSKAWTCQKDLNAQNFAELRDTEENYLMN